MTQIALPLAVGSATGPRRIVIGNGNQSVPAAFAATADWPYRTAVLVGPPRSGKSLFARWFAEAGYGNSVDDAHLLDETALFHAWNRAQETDTPLLLIGGAAGSAWRVQLPDLASRVGAALQLEIVSPDDAMLGELIFAQAEQRGLALGPDAIAYLVPRLERSYLGVERLVAAIDRISLERKIAPTLSVWRDALDEVIDPHEPRLL